MTTDKPGLGDTGDTPTSEMTTPATTTPAEDDILLAEAAYAQLERLFVAHISAFMLKAGRYIIDTFYGGDARLALTKKGASQKQNSLRLLIGKLRSAPNDPSGNIPSVVWFYKAVSLASHESICRERRSLSTFINLGHSHKLLLLSVPKITTLRSAPDDAAIDAAFDEKERLARIAIDENLSVRDFARRIREEHPGTPPPLSLDDLPARDALREQPPATLRRLYDTARTRIDEDRMTSQRHRQALYDLSVVLTEIGADAAGNGSAFAPEAGEAVGICTGCINDCLYCPVKIRNAGDPAAKQPADWANVALQRAEVIRPRTVSAGTVAFPVDHDIFPQILDECIEVLGKLLRAGNDVLITTRPRLACIQAIGPAAAYFKDRIVFRFVIGADDSRVLSFWEPGAPGFEERRESLAWAYEAGFRTSAAVTPMLVAPRIADLLAGIRPFISEEIWLGTMHQVDAIENWSQIDGFERQLELIRSFQAPKPMATVHEAFRSDPLVKWTPETLAGISGGTKQSAQESATPER